MEYITDPRTIEKKSMEIIDEALGPIKCGPDELRIIKRVIHTTADFEYRDNLTFHNQPIEAAIKALSNGRKIVTDTMMASAGINKSILKKRGIGLTCLISNDETANLARAKGITRAMASMELAAQDKENGIFVIGNAPTALFRLMELFQEGELRPDLVIGVPVGFVGAAESKEALAQVPLPSILSRGRKGGSNVAAAIINAILYMMEEKGL